MNKEESYREQIEKHRQRIDRVKPAAARTSELPPRARVHRHAKKKTAVKLKYPVIRLLVLFFILLPLTVFSIISYWGESKTKPINANGAASGGYDNVVLDGGRGENPESSRDTEHAEETKNEQGIDEDSGQKEEDVPEEHVKQPALPADEEISESDGKDGVQQDKTAEESASTGTPSSSTIGAKPQSSKSESSSNSEKMLYHTVKPGETLFRIAMNYYKSQDGIEIIRKANGIKENEIKVGETLKIPIK
ncbi:LysM peptidoglycan-binding domain-containing protein [Bacillus sp. B-jedd]|uniref:LysM peptidoglycan-binding domain-containing protein n=1 Tax=Bacillus sp. B-jedd TaxID=1476857 RepID=UPI0005155E27|nr:LysM peptidoglycan-binding domain-containing protein [Bacillus sp. B-jedd]CEG27687.1 peptidoglycan-binding protein [Bacillus sp. B-jedd]